MRERIDARELLAWKHYWALDPWGPERVDHAFARLSVLVARLAGSKRNWRPSDFMPKFGPPPEPRKPEEILAAFRRSAAGFN